MQGVDISAEILKMAALTHCTFIFPEDEERCCLVALSSQGGEQCTGERSRVSFEGISLIHDSSIRRTPPTATPLGG